mmetsp:Transcript_15789/g.20607  ORF Transcript_15789/g.20607 Transcript_15789/m.20607 type:complete len:135 (-) Transcript_15789:347-751(-)
MMRIASLLLLVASSALAFTTPKVSVRSTSASARSMFSKDDGEKFRTTPQPLQSMDEPEPEKATDVDQTATNLVKDMNTGELKEVAWVDPYMMANTDATGLGWAYIFILGPGILLLNDAFHFIPPNSPLSFVTHY